MADWYYIGHYGQLGPLTREQLEELIAGGVVTNETYVWCTGMGDWLPAERVQELRSKFVPSSPVAPPPPPTPRFDPPAPRPYGASGAPSPYTNYSPQSMPTYNPVFSAGRSDRSRVLGGVLNLILPGVGRMYLGYAAIGVLQLGLFFCGGVGLIWSFIDGILILTGAVKMDGYGRELPQ